MHVSTAMFKKAGIKIFNYGIQGRFLSHYPTMLQNAVRAKPKFIVISMDKPQFYQPALSSLIYPKLFSQELDISSTSIKFFYNCLENFDSLKIFIHLLVGYFIHLNYFV